VSLPMPFRLAERPHATPFLTSPTICLFESGPSDGAIFLWDCNRPYRREGANQAYTNGSNWGQQFTLDPWGNLTAVSAISGKGMVGVFTASATTQNQLSCKAGCASSYDAAGNTTSDGNGTITYDAENRISTAGGVTYTYDGDGKRVEKSSGTLYWTGVGSDALSESDLSGNFNEEYVFYDGMRVSRIDRPSSTSHAFLTDQLGSIRMIGTASDTSTLKVEQDLDYTPYGIVTTGTPADPYQFTGKERDPESGLENFGARYNASILGRFMTPDWAAKPASVPYANFGNPQSLNLYSYVENNPTTLGDPDGHGDTPALNCASGASQNDAPLKCVDTSTTAQKKEVAQDKGSWFHKLLGYFYWKVPKGEGFEVKDAKIGPFKFDAGYRVKGKDFKQTTKGMEVPPSTVKSGLRSRLVRPKWVCSGRRRKRKASPQRSTGYRDSSGETLRVRAARWELVGAHVSLSAAGPRWVLTPVRC
jgi:RHS repeat-associated protein